MLYLIGIEVYCQKFVVYNNLFANYPFQNQIYSIGAEKNGKIWVSDGSGKLASFNGSAFQTISPSTSGITQNTEQIRGIFSPNESETYFVTTYKDIISQTGGLVRLKQDVWNSFNSISPISSPSIFNFSTYNRAEKSIYFNFDENFQDSVSIYKFNIVNETFSKLKFSGNSCDTLFRRADIYKYWNRTNFIYFSQKERCEFRISNGINNFHKIKLVNTSGKKCKVINCIAIDSTKILAIGLDSSSSVFSSQRSLFLCDTHGRIHITQYGPVVENYNTATVDRGTIYLGTINGELILINKRNKKLKFGNLPSDFPVSGPIRSIINDSLGNKWFGTGKVLVKLSDVNCQFQPIQKSGCKGQTLSFDSKTTTIGDGIKTYIWKFGNNLAQTFGAAQGDTARFTFSNPGTYRVKLIAIDSNGVTDSSFQQVSILNSPGVQLNIEDSIVSCKTSISLTAFNGTKPTWYFPDGSKIFNAQSILTNGEGLYVVKDTLTIDSISCYSSDSIRLIKSPPSLGSLELSNSTNGNTITTDTIFSSDIKSILISGTPQGSTFSLVVNGDNLKKNPAIVSTDSLDKLDIFYTSKDQDSCQFFVSKTVYIKTKIVVPEPPKPEFVPNLPNLITANNDAFNQSFTDKTGSFPAGYTLEVFNRWGQSIFKRENYQNEWPETATKEGLYFYMLTSPTGTKYTGWVDMMR